MTSNFPEEETTLKEQETKIPRFPEDKPCIYALRNSSSKKRGKPTDEKELKNGESFRKRADVEKRSPDNLRYDGLYHPMNAT